MREELRDEGRLTHIIEAIDNACEFVEGIAFDEYCNNKMMRFAVVKNVEIVGEASYMLTKELKAQHPEINWKKIIKMRHVMVHGYYLIEDEIVWDIIKEDFPVLKKQIKQIISNR
jgi:uncharacterized protein with HEPN domain